MDKRLIKVETNMDNIDESLREQKVYIKENKDKLEKVSDELNKGLNAILRELKK